MRDLDVNILTVINSKNFCKRKKVTVKDSCSFLSLSYHPDIAIINSDTFIYKKFGKLKNLIKNT